MSQTRIAIVDNDEVARSGAHHLLAKEPQLAVVASLDHYESLQWDHEWQHIDVVLLDACDPQREGDQFPGVGVARHIRRASGDNPRIIVLTGQFFHDGLRRRMIEAGVDAFASRWDGMGGADLLALILGADTPPKSLLSKLPPDLGITDTTSVNSLVDQLDSQDLHGVLDERMRKRHAAHGDRSRWWNSVRTSFAGPRGLEPRSTSGDIQFDRDMPSVPQLRRFASWATRADHQRRQ